MYDCVPGPRSNKCCDSIRSVSKSKKNAFFSARNARARSGDIPCLSWFYSNCNWESESTAFPVDHGIFQQRHIVNLHSSKWRRPSPFLVAGSIWWQEVAEFLQHSQGQHLTPATHSHFGDVNQSWFVDPTRNGLGSTTCTWSALKDILTYPEISVNFGSFISSQVAMKHWQMRWTKTHSTSARNIVNVFHKIF